MSTIVNVAGSSYSVPSEGDSNWANDVSNLLIQLATSTKVLQSTSSNFPLTQDLSFGTNYGLKIQYIKSQATNPAGTGIVRLGNNESVAWRNSTNGADLSLKVNSSDLLEFNGSPIQAAMSVSDTSTVDLTLSSNTISADVKADSITNSHINSAAAIAYSKLALSNTIVNADVSASAAIAYSKLNLANSIVNADINSAAAISYSKLNLVGSIVNADINASAAIAYSKLALTNSIVNADISSSAAIAYSKLNLASSIVNADINASAAIEVSKLETLATEKLVVTNPSGKITTISTSAIEAGYLSGVTSAVQTQLDAKVPKSLTTTTGDMIYASGANTPARLAVGSSGQVLKSVGGLPTWATFSGGINYISSNPDAEADTSGWSTYADAAGTSPVDGTGGSPNSTWTRTTSSPLRGSASFLYTHNSGASRQGEGVSYAFTIDTSDKAKVMQISFDYMIASGTFVAGSSGVESDLTVWIYDVTNSTLIQPSSYKLFSNSSSIADKFNATFQTASNSTSYRLIIHNGTTSTAAFTAMFDNFNVGPSTYVYGTPVTDWEAITLTGSWSTNTSYSSKRRRVGDTREYQVTVTLSGAPNASSLSINLPETIDTSKITTSGNNILGKITVIDSGVSALLGNVAYNTSTSVLAQIENTAGTYTVPNSITNTVPITFGNLDTLYLTFSVPIAGLSSSVQMSDSTDTRVVDFVGYPSTNQALTANTTNVNLTTLKDSHGAWTGSTYVVPVSGDYDINCVVIQSSTNATYQVYLNSSVVRSIVTASTASHLAGSVFLPNLKAGDIISFRADTTSTILGLAQAGAWSIKRITGPSAIAATETIAASYWLSANQAVTANVSPINFDSKEFDTHNAVTTGASWKFTAPASGIYEMSIAGYCNTGGCYLYIWKNGTKIKWISYINNVGSTLGTGPQLIKLNAGDYIEFRGDTSVTIYGGTLDSTNVAKLSIKRIGN